MVKFGRVLFALYDGQTDRNADILITILPTSPEGENVNWIGQFISVKISLSEMRWDQLLRSERSFRPTLRRCRAMLCGTMRHRISYERCLIHPSFSNILITRTKTRNIIITESQIIDILTIIANFVSCHLSVCHFTCVIVVRWHENDWMMVAKFGVI